MPEQDQKRRRPTFWQMLHSVLMAVLGVQSDKNRARDFTHGRALDFLVIGLLVAVGIILLIFGLVQLIVRSAG